MAMSSDVIDVDPIVDEKQKSGNRKKPSFVQMTQPPPEQNLIERIQKAIQTTQEVINDPQSVMKKRELPKSGKEPLPFEDDEYLEDQKKARDRVIASQKKLGTTRGDKPGEYLPLKYEPKLIREYYLREPV